MESTERQTTKSFSLAYATHPQHREQWRWNRVVSCRVGRPRVEMANGIIEIYFKDKQLGNRIGGDVLRWDDINWSVPPLPVTWHG